MPNANHTGPLDIHEALLTPPERADLDSVAQHFANIAGGPRGMAQLLYDEFRHADEGSPVRARVMEMVFRSLGKLEGKSADDLSLMDDADLERLLELKLRKIGHGRTEATSAGNPIAAATERQVEEAEKGATSEAESEAGPAPFADGGSGASEGDPSSARAGSQ